MMETLKKHTRLWVPLLALVSLGTMLTLALAGELEPTGPPAPTMKTLEDVEPRTAIRNAFDTLTPIVISQSGSYYLAEDIYAFHTKHGIEITASNVTLDMNGFTLYGNTEVGSWDGIHGTSMDNITIMNGTVQDFFQDGIDLQGDNIEVIKVRVLNNGQRGMLTGSNSVIRDCIAANNTGNGIDPGGASTIIGCISRDSVNGNGINSSNATIENCSARSNGGDGIFSNTGSVIRGCTAAFNTGDGIDAQASLVQGNAATGNTGNDIVGHASSTIVDNDT